MASDTRNSSSKLDALGLVEDDKIQTGVVELLERLAERIEHIDRKIDELCEGANHPEPARDYYSIADFADLVGKSQYTVREWCRLQRIYAEKCETGRGDAKSWKISRDELQRYRDHGLLPAKYLR